MLGRSPVVCDTSGVGFTPLSSVPKSSLMGKVVGGSWVGRVPLLGTCDLWHCSFLSSLLLAGMDNDRDNYGVLWVSH